LGGKRVAKGWLSQRFKAAKSLVSAWLNCILVTKLLLLLPLFLLLQRAHNNANNNNNSFHTLKHTTIHPHSHTHTHTGALAHLWQHKLERALLILRLSISHSHTES